MWLLGTGSLTPFGARLKGDRIRQIDEFRYRRDYACENWKLAFFVETFFDARNDCNYPLELALSKGQRHGIPSPFIERLMEIGLA